MIQRLWILVSLVWAGVFLANGATKVNGIQEGDLLIAVIPPLTVLLLARAAVWVLRG